MRKKIGIIGGLSPESTVTYYLHITRRIVEIYGDCSYPDIILYSVNLGKYNIWREEDQWDKIAEDMIYAAKKLEQAGAEIGLIATNTMHKVFNQVQASTSVPYIHILDPVVEAVNNNGYSNPALLGTLSTMTQDFYKNKLKSGGLSPILPDPDDMTAVHEIIFNELVKGVITEESGKKYYDVIDNLKKKGADSVILGCTEIPLLIQQESCSLPLFDTALLHAEAAFKSSTGV